MALQAAIAHPICALDDDPKQGPSWQLLCMTHHVHGDAAKAAERPGAWRQIDPDNPQIGHLSAGLGAGAVPKRASDRCVAHVFDEFAASFDRKGSLLQYRAPQLCADLLATLADRLPASAVILDAGCGTGLCGPLLRPFCSRLVGVDLSSRMLERARDRAADDELHCAELTAFLECMPESLDAVVSADTLCGMALQSLSKDVLRREMDEPVDGWLVCATRAVQDGAHSGVSQ